MALQLQKYIHANDVSGHKINSHTLNCEDPVSMILADAWTFAQSACYRCNIENMVGNGQGTRWDCWAVEG